MTEPVRCQVGSPRCSFADLARKYADLVRLRDGSTPFDGARLRSLSREFPGALRELDALPFEELGERLRLAQGSALGGAALAPFLDWMRAYHDTMRLALEVRARLRRERNPNASLVSEIVGAFAPALDGSCDADFVNSVARPPEGRLNRLVFARLSARFGLSPRALEERLFRAEAA